MAKIIDMTITYENGMTGMSQYHPVVTLQRMAKIEEVGRNTSSILLGSHLGTHMDAPSHFIPGGGTIENTPLDVCMGEVTIVDARHRGPGSRLLPEDLAGLALKERVLLNFGWATRWATDQYLRDFPTISPEAAAVLLERGVRLVAMDTPSPDGCPKGGKQDYIIHRTMLAKGVIFVESLIHTEQIDPSSTYQMIALPLKLAGTDASPCRAVLVRKD